MSFNSFAEFLHMGGYGFYVWLSYGFTAALLIILVINSKRKEKQLFAKISQRLKREAKLKQVAKQNSGKIKQEQVNPETVNTDQFNTTQENKG